MRSRVLFGTIGCVCLLNAPVRAAFAQTPDETLAAASALFDAQKYASAATRLEAFLKANPKHPKAGAAALALARCYAEQKQFAQAIPAYEKAIASKQADVLVTARLGLGEAAITTGDYAKAIAALAPVARENLPAEQASVVWMWLGQAYFARKQYEPAETAYLRVTTKYENSPDAPNAWYGAALAALRLNKKDAAKPRLQTYLDRYPNSPDRPQAMLLLAQIHLDAKDYGRARILFERAAGSNGTTPAFHAEAEDGLIQALLELKDYGEAANRLDAALARLPESDPQRFRALLSLGQCRYRQGQFEPAFTAYIGASKSAEPEVAAQGYYWAGNSALALKRNEEAAAQFAKLTAKFPQQELAPRAELKAGDAYLAAKKNEAASAAYRIVAAKYPKSPEAADARKALAGLAGSLSDPAQLLAALKDAPAPERNAGRLRAARLYLDARNVEAAVPVLASLIADKPGAEIAAEADYLLGLSYETQQKTAPAADALAQAVTLKPDAAWTADAQQHLALLYLNNHQSPKAEKAANAALSLKLEPADQEQMRLVRMQAQTDQQKWDAALAGSQELLANSASPDATTAALFTQAWILDRQNKQDAALPVWERLARDFPKSPNAADAFVRIGDARFEAKKFDEARDKFAQVAADFPQSPLLPEARFKLGSSLFHLEKYDDAASAFRSAAESKGAGEMVPEALYWQGVALDKAGHKIEAIAPLTRLVAKYPKSPRVTNANVRLAALKAVSGK